MRIMGLKNSIFILSYYISEFFIAFFPTLGIIFLSKKLFLQNTSILVISIVWYINWIILTPFSLILNTIFSEPKIAKGCNALFTSILMLVQLYLIF